MLPRMVAICCVGAAAQLIAGCSAPDDSELYGNPLPQTSAGGGGAATGGAQNGGSENGGTSGSGGALEDTGGQINPNGGAGAGGSDPNPTGGRPNSSGGAPPSNGGANTGGGGPFDVTQCNFTGAWASYAKIPVKWPATVVLLEGSGFIEQRALTLQEQVPGTLIVKTRTYPCGIYLPDLQSNIFQNNMKFGIRFPDVLFDRGVLPPGKYEIRGAPTPDGKSGELISEPFALLAGATLDTPVTDPWPVAAKMKLADDDKDGAPGISVVPADGQGYARPPLNVNPFDTDRAMIIDIAERTVQSFKGTVSSCDEFEAQLDILTVANKPAIDSTVVGCTKASGTKCTADEAKFVDDNRPAFVPDGPGTLTIKRIPDGSECAYVRQVYPLTSVSK